jgi:hypothetical protein
MERKKKGKKHRKAREKAEEKQKVLFQEYNLQDVKVKFKEPSDSNQRSNVEVKFIPSSCKEPRSNERVSKFYYKEKEVYLLRDPEELQKKQPDQPWKSKKKSRICTSLFYKKFVTTVRGVSFRKSLG